MSNLLIKWWVWKIQRNLKTGLPHLNSRRESIKKPGTRLLSTVTPAIGRGPVFLAKARI
jgi:hypothetical protein